MSTPDLRPSHLRNSDREVTACGTKITDGSGYPYVATRHAPMHIARRAMPVCALCAAVTTVVPFDGSRNP